jgi:hypothetical protein
MKKYLVTFHVRTRNTLQNFEYCREAENLLNRIFRAYYNVYGVKIVSWSKTEIEMEMTANWIDWPRYKPENIIKGWNNALMRQAWWNRLEEVWYTTKELA